MDAKFCTIYVFRKGPVRFCKGLSKWEVFIQRIGVFDSQKFIFSTQNSKECVTIVKKKNEGIDIFFPHANLLCLQVSDIEYVDKYDQHCETVYE